MEEVTHTDNTIDTILKKSYNMFRQGNFEEPTALLSEALGMDFDCDEVVAALKSANFWRERQKKIQTITLESERGDYLFSQWDLFIQFLQRFPKTYETGIYPIKQWVFSMALTCFQSILERTGKHDPELLCNVGRSYKGMGNYEDAVEFFEAANHQRMDDPAILAELADSYAFINEVKAAKIFFREAFFIDPQKVNIKSLESMLICRLVENVREMGYPEEAVKEWVPVYGTIFSVFNIKRELKPLEFGKLRQAIFDYEQKVHEPETEDRELLVPRLINKYFWLIDHLIATKSDRKKIEEVLMKIKEIDQSIFEKYVN